MTHTKQQLRQGAAYYVRASLWNQGTASTSGLPVPDVNNSENLGGMHTQIFSYQLGTASTSLASGIIYSASGTATTGTATITATGALVTASVATFDVPRGVRITASVNLSTTTFQIIGTDGYGASQTHQLVGPTGNTFGNVGSYVDSLVTFKTVNQFAIQNPTASGVATTAFAVDNNDTYGLPYRIPNVGRGQDGYINGNSATVPGTWVGGYTATGTTTASTTDVRGTYAYATTSLADGVKYLTLQFIMPEVGVTPDQDTKENTYGAAPFGS